MSEATPLRVSCRGELAAGFLGALEAAGHQVVGESGPAESDVLCVVPAAEVGVDAAVDSVKALLESSGAGILLVVDEAASLDDWRGLDVDGVARCSANASSAEFVTRLESAPALRRVSTLAAIREEKLALTRQSLEVISMVDLRTGLHNRRFLLNGVTDALAAARRYERVFSLCRLRVTNHADILKTHGESVMLEVYEFVADYLAVRLRSADIEAWVAQDAFAVILPETDADGARVFATRLVDEIQAEEFLGGVQLQLHATVVDSSRGFESAAEMVQVVERGDT